MIGPQTAGFSKSDQANIRAKLESLIILVQKGLPFPVGSFPPFFEVDLLIWGL